ncbi:hypothetical protein Ahy_B03g062137 isoform D [Arachis hypogaea]|uniref:Alpha N-terminal protein methyltransferase 1 n=1 Tax=Arachis hypogaea TaxID=3818 RepID=A0A444ZT61_ARAHY|nr:hypothetical protein Ahy_B03g062137 isoform D [Arachis hypogaea]
MYFVSSLNATFQLSESNVVKANWAFSNRECSVIGFFRTCVSLSSGSSHRCSVSFPPNRQIRCMDAAGLDSDGREFKSPDEMWTEQAGDPNKKTLWYRNGVSYWEGVEASMDGVLGGFANVNEPDIKCSEEFLKIILSERFPADARHQPLVALDCGSGIGRITKNLLIRHFNEVDLLEPVSHFLEAARQTLGPENHMNSDTHKAVNFYCVPLQDFTPESERYDVIWIQWCIGHLTDDDFVSFFKRAKVGLKPGGLFILKENLARSGFVLDNEDRSVTRSDLYFKELFSRCGLHVYKSKDQRGFPEELFAVKIYALTTDVPKKVNRTRSKSQANRPRIIKTWNYKAVCEDSSRVEKSIPPFAQQDQQQFLLRCSAAADVPPFLCLDESDVVFRATSGKWRAVVVEISRMHKTGRPVLVGTTSVEQSDSLSEQLKEAGIPHEEQRLLTEHTVLTEDQLWRMVLHLSLFLQFIILCQYCR